MKHFTEITFYDEPTDRQHYDTAEEAAEAFADAIDAAQSQGHHFGDWAQIRQGTETAKARKITRRFNNPMETA